MPSSQTPKRWLRRVNEGGAPRRWLFRGVYWGQLRKPDWQAMAVDGKVALARRRHSGRYAATGSRMRHQAEGLQAAIEGS